MVSFGIIIIISSEEKTIFIVTLFIVLISGKTTGTLIHCILNKMIIFYMTKKFSIIKNITNTPSEF